MHYRSNKEGVCNKHVYIKNSMEEKDLEQIVLQGLQIEAIEKEKASERKALTRKHGLKPEEAKYSQDYQGQTRDIVAKKLGISGRHWERMKFIYQHRDCLVDKEYENWRIGKLSTSKIYNLVIQDIQYNETLDKMMELLEQMHWEALQYERSYVHVDIEHNLTSALHSCRDKTKEEVLANFRRLKECNQNYLNKRYNEISVMKSHVRDLKHKLQNKAHKGI